MKPSVEQKKKLDLVYQLKKHFNSERRSFKINKWTKYFKSRKSSSLNQKEKEILQEKQRKQRTHYHQRKTNQRIMMTKDKEKIQ